MFMFCYVYVMLCLCAPPSEVQRTTLGGGGRAQLRGSMVAHRFVVKRLGIVMIRAFVVVGRR